MTGDRLQAHSLLGIRREADIQLGLGVVALVVAATGTWWLLQGRLHSSVWLGVAGALTLAGTFLSESRRARDEYARHSRSDASDTAMRQTALGPAQQGVLATHRRRLLGFLVFGILASIGGPGLNVLLGIVTRVGPGTLDLLAWVVFALPISLAVWMLPPRGLGVQERAEERGGGGNIRKVCS